MPTKSTPNNWESAYWTLYQDKDGKTLTPSSVVKPYTDSRDGGLNPDWRRDIAAHRCATTSLTGRKYKYEKRPGIYTTMYRFGSTGDITNSRYGVVHSNFSAPAPNVVSWSDSNNLALARFIKRCRKSQTDFSGSVALGELAETLRMIRNPSQTLRRGISDYIETVKKRARSRRNVRAGQRLPRNSRVTKANEIVSATWLEYAFGWTPLISDIKSGAEALAKGKPEFWREYAKVRAGASINTSHTYSVDYSTTVNSRNTYSWRWLDVKTAYVNYLGQVKREVNNDYKIEAKRFGFTPDQFLPTVWELIPYSFLVDYFTNIGDVIDAFSFHTADIAWVQRTIRKRSFQRTIDMRHHVNSNKSNVISSGGTWIGSETRHPYSSVDAVDVTRAQYTGTLTPKVTIEIPGMGRKWINMSALASQHFTAKKAIRKAWRI